MKLLLWAVMCLTVQALPHSQDKEGAAVMKEEPSKTNEIKTSELVPAESKKDDENQKPSNIDSKVSSEKKGKALPHCQDKEGTVVMKEEPPRTNEIKTPELVPAEYKKDDENQKPSDIDTKVSSEKEGKSASAEQAKETLLVNAKEPNEKSTTKEREGTTEKSTTAKNMIKARNFWIKETQTQNPTWLHLFVGPNKQGMPKQEDVSNSELKSGDSQKIYRKIKRDLNKPCC